MGWLYSVALGASASVGAHGHHVKGSLSFVQLWLPALIIIFWWTTTGLDMNGTNLKKFQTYAFAEKHPRSWTLKIIFWLYLSQFLSDFDEIVAVSGN